MAFACIPQIIFEIELHCREVCRDIRYRVGRIVLRTNDFNEFQRHACDGRRTIIFNGEVVPTGHHHAINAVAPLVHLVVVHRKTIAIVQENFDLLARVRSVPKV